MINTAPSAKKRLKILEEVYKKGKSVASVCRRNKISRTVFYKWAKRYKNNLSKKENIRNLRDKKRKIIDFPNKVSDEVVEKIKEIAAEKPHLSKYGILEKLNFSIGEKKAVGVHGVYNVLKRGGLNTPKKRKSWRKFVLKKVKRILTPEERLEIINKSEKLGVSVSQVCRDFGISRQTYYKWKRRWDSKRHIDILKDRKPKYDKRHLRIDREREDAILSIIIEHPDFSKYKVAKELYRKFKKSNKSTRSL